MPDVWQKCLYAIPSISTEFAEERSLRNQKGCNKVKIGRACKGSGPGTPFWLWWSPPETQCYQIHGEFKCIAKISNVWRGWDEQKSDASKLPKCLRLQTPGILLDYWTTIRTKQACIILAINDTCSSYYLDYKTKWWRYCWPQDSMKRWVGCC